MRFGELSLLDGPIGRTQEYHFPPYILSFLGSLGVAKCARSVEEA